MPANYNRCYFTTTPWTITLTEFSELSTKKIVKYFSPTHNNVVFRFRAEFSAGMEDAPAEKFGLSIIYEDGPLSKLKDVGIDVDIRIPQDPYRHMTHFGPYEAKRGVAKKKPDFDDKDLDTFKKKYGLMGATAVDYVIFIDIPSSCFDYRIASDAVDPSPAWSSSLYGTLENVEKSNYSDVQLVSGDGKKFYCHCIVIGQSAALAATLCNPKSEKEKAGEFLFATLDEGALDAILMYLYTGQCDVGQLETRLIIQVADFGEQYNLKNLKEKCTTILWQRVADRPIRAMEILRFADLHGEIYLKDRALDVLMENYESLSVQPDAFSLGNDDDLQGKRLQREFNLHAMRRLWVWYK